MFGKVDTAVRFHYVGQGFDGAYVHRLMTFVSGGHTAVVVNGTVGPFFANGRGLRIGDPISPLLFNFVVDALSCILIRATAAGDIKGCLPPHPLWYFSPLVRGQYDYHG